MGALSRLLGTDDATVAHRFVLLWEQKIRPDLEAEIVAMQAEGAALADGANAISAKEVRALLKALLKTADTRVTVRANEVMGRRPTKKTVKKTSASVQDTTET